MLYSSHLKVHVKLQAKTFVVRKCRLGHVDRLNTDRCYARVIICIKMFVIYNVYDHTLKQREQTQVATNPVRKSSLDFLEPGCVEHIVILYSL